MIDVLGVDVDMEYEVFIYNLIPKENDNQLTCFYAILWNPVSQSVLCVYNTIKTDQTATNITSHFS